MYTFKKYNIIAVGLLVMFVTVSCTTAGFAQGEEGLVGTGGRTRWDAYLKKEANWYQSEEAIQIAENVLLFQRESGGWPKNLNMNRELSKKEKKKLIAQKKEKDATIDNGATFPQLRFLAKVYNATGKDEYRKSFEIGLDYLFEAQYPNGGWPQFYPLRKGYYSHITFNDNAMSGVMNLLRDIAQNKPDFSFVPVDDKNKAGKAIENGLALIIKTQIEVNGKLTGWCAQYDEETLKPADARSYELASISGMETVDLIVYLMSIEQPSPEIINSVQSACLWLESSKITGYRMEYTTDSTSARKFNRFLVEDPEAKPLWARFYEIETNQPLYIDRGGIKRNSHNELSDERRNGYAYVGDFASDLLDNKYPKWKAKNKL
jgi:PelA/Pel-15E family pectate lyase